MIINRIRMDGYKNIFDTTLLFNNITVLIALNNYGKSNVLECIEFAHQFIRYSDKLQLMSDISRLPINLKTAENDFTFEIEFITTLEKEEVTAVYEFSFEWIKDDNKGCVIKHELLKIKKNTPGSKFSTFVKRYLGECHYKSSHQSRATTKLRIGSEELAINKLGHFDDLYYVEVVKSLNKVNFHLNTLYDTSGAFDYVPPIELIKESVYFLNRSRGYNISKVIYHLRKNNPDKYELLINSFKSLVPTIQYIEPVCLDIQTEEEKEFEIKVNIKGNAPVKITEKVYRIRVKEIHNNQVTDFSGLSNGTKRIFIILTSAILAGIIKIPLIAFEELENCIHPYLFQRLLMILKELINDSRMIITSHSPYIIQYIDLDSIYIGYPSDEGLAQFKKVKKSLHKSLNRYAAEENVSTGDYIFNILVESYLDNNEIISILE